LSKAILQPDISYRHSSDGLFTSFYPNTPEGEKAWNIINATPGAEGGKVLAAHAESTIKQLRDAGYTKILSLAPESL
jgi:ribosomal protein L14